MAPRIPPIEPIAPGSRVAVILENADGSRTIGHRGTLLGVSLRSICRAPQDRNAWEYRIMVPELQRVVLVGAKHFLVTHQVDGREELALAADTARLESAAELWKLEFTSPVSNDNVYLSGKFRYGEREHGRFCFVKSNVKTTLWQLRMPASRNLRGRSMIYCEVPARRVLDRSFVCNVLAYLMQLPEPQEA